LEGVEELLIKIGEDITVGKPEVEVYDRFYSVLERYVGRVAPEALTLAVKYIWLTQIVVGTASILGEIGCVCGGAGAEEFNCGDYL
jgi:hypothetical protein